MRFIIAWIAGCLTMMFTFSIMIGYCELWVGIAVIIALNALAIFICVKRHKNKKDAFWEGLRSGHLKK